MSVPGCTASEKMAGREPANSVTVPMVSRIVPVTGSSSSSRLSVAELQLGNPVAQPVAKSLPVESKARPDRFMDWGASDVIEPSCWSSVTISVTPDP